MKCPTCNDVNLVISERYGTEINFCPVCRGIWLFRGELDKIIERDSVPQVQQKHEDRKPKKYDGPHGYKKKKCKSFFGELLDF
jgi:uncharacterized protein